MNLKAGLGARVFTAGVAVCFGTGALLAKYAYLAGSNAISVMTVRSCAALLWVLVLLRATRTPLRLGGAVRWKALALGILMCVNTFGLYNAIEHMPAPLAILTFYTYPLVVAAVQVLRGRERMSARRILAFVLAFAGLVLALDAGSLRATPAGVCSAAIGSLAFTLLLFTTTRWFPTGDSRPRTAHMIAASCCIFALVAALSGRFVLPRTALGLFGFFGLCITFPLAITGLFVAMGRVGPGDIALLMNFEPLTVILLSAAFLGETLSPLQSMGAAMVLAGLLLGQWRLATGPPAGRREARS